MLIEGGCLVQSMAAILNAMGGAACRYLFIPKKFPIEAPLGAITNLLSQIHSRFDDDVRIHRT